MSSDAWLKKRVKTDHDSGVGWGASPAYRVVVARRLHPPVVVRAFTVKIALAHPWDGHCFVLNPRQMGVSATTKPLDKHLIVF